MDYAIAFIAALVALSTMPSALLGYLIAGIGFRQYPRAVAFGIGWALVTELIVALLKVFMRGDAYHVGIFTVARIVGAIIMTSIIFAGANRFRAIRNSTTSPATPDRVEKDSGVMPDLVEEDSSGVMPTSRLSRGFHRLALFLAGILFVLGGAWSAIAGLESANNSLSRHQQLVCAHERVAQPVPGENVFDKFDDVSLKDIGCSDGLETVTVEEARKNPPNFYWTAIFAGVSAGLMLWTLAFSLAVYGIVRAIGWVIGGFAVS